MADLIAQGPGASDRWRRKIPLNETILLGRTSANWATPWDEKISRDHVQATWRDSGLQIVQLETARNPVFFNGEQRSKFIIHPGEHFVIGSTTFTVSNEQVMVTLDTPNPMTEQLYKPQFLRQVRYRDADKRIAVLSKLSEIISSASNDNELFVNLVNVLLTGISRANAVALVAIGNVSSNDDLIAAQSSEASREAQKQEPEAIRILHWDRRRFGDHEFQPSDRLIRQAVSSGQSVVHIWREGKAREHAFTISAEGDWAFATPVISDACRGWALYVTGGYTSGTGSTSPDTNPDDLRDDIKFTELAATTLANLRQVRMLEKTQATLGQFFSPVVLKAIEGQDPEKVLKPREAIVSVLFCDLRGFSRTSEKAVDNLHDLLNRVSQALGVTTHHILAHEGVVGDFHGDAAMGFWGWPIEHSLTCQRACLAALSIRAELDRTAADPDHPLHGYQMGLGIATGKAVAGKIGTVDQVKVTAFGPVVNLASRLEGMTRFLRARILLDEDSARRIREAPGPPVARVRRVAKVRPYGLDTPLVVSELLPLEKDFPQLTDAHIAAYEEALDALMARDWHKAFQLLHRVPAEDEVKDFLTVYIAQHNRTAPKDWDGVIALAGK
jgi:adenylate cyclase